MCENSGGAKGWLEFNPLLPLYLPMHQAPTNCFK